MNLLTTQTTTPTPEEFEERVNQIASANQRQKMVLVNANETAEGENKKWNENFITLDQLKKIFQSTERKEIGGKTAQVFRLSFEKLDLTWKTLTDFQNIYLINSERWNELGEDQKTYYLNYLDIWDNSKRVRNPELREKYTLMNEGFLGSKGTIIQQKLNLINWKNKLESLNSETNFYEAWIANYETFYRSKDKKGKLTTDEEKQRKAWEIFYGAELNEKGVEQWKVELTTGYQKLMATRWFGTKVIKKTWWGDDTKKVGTIKAEDRKALKESWEALNFDQAVIEWACQKLGIESDKQQDLWKKLGLERDINELLKEAERADELTEAELFELADSLNKNSKHNEKNNKQVRNVGIFWLQKYLAEKQAIITADFLASEFGELLIEINEYWGKKMKIAEEDWGELKVVEILENFISVRKIYSPVSGSFKERANIIKNLVARLEAIIQTENGSKWEEKIFFKKNLVNLFYHKDLEDREVEPAWKFLTACQTIFARKELEQTEMERNNFKKNIEIADKQIVKYAVKAMVNYAVVDEVTGKNLGYAKKYELTKEYWEHFDIEEGVKKAAKVFSAPTPFYPIAKFYAEWGEKIGEDTSNNHQWVLENIHGDNWQTEFTKKVNKVAVWKIWKEWKSNLVYWWPSSTEVEVNLKSENEEFERETIQDIQNQLKDFSVEDIKWGAEKVSLTEPQVEKIMEATSLHQLDKLIREWNDEKDKAESPENEERLKAIWEKIKGCETTEPDDRRARIKEIETEWAAKLTESEARQNIENSIKKTTDTSINFSALVNLPKQLEDLSKKEVENKILVRNPGLQAKLNTAAARLNEKIAAWNDFFATYNIENNDDKDIWYREGNIEDCERLFKSKSITVDNYFDDGAEIIDLLRTDLTEEEKRIMNDAKTPKKVVEAWNKIEKGHQEDRRAEIELIREIQAVLDKRGKIGNEELLYEINSYCGWETSDSKRKRVAHRQMKDKIEAEVQSINDRIRDIEEAKRKEAESNFVNGFIHHSARNSSEKLSREEILRFWVWGQSGGTMAQIYDNEWEINHGKVEEVKGGNVFRKVETEIDEGLVYPDVNGIGGCLAGGALWVRYRGKKHPANEFSKSELDFLNELTHLQNGTNGEVLPDGWEGYQNWKNRVGKLTAEQVHDIIGRGWENNKLETLQENEFITEFGATSLIRAQILAYHGIESPNRAHKIDGTQAKKANQGNWTATEIRLNNDGRHAINEGGAWIEYNWENNSKVKRVEDVWIKVFKDAGGPRGTGSLSRTQILDYRKTNAVPAPKARKSYENYWEATHLTWAGGKLMANNYTSHGETDNLEAEQVNKSELDKANALIKQIKGAGAESALPSDGAISGYVETTLPLGKKYNYLKTLRNNKKNQIEEVRKWAKVQPDITEIENELNKTPTVSLNYDYQQVIINLADNDTKRGQKKAEIIAEIKRLRTEKIANEEQQNKERKEKEERERKELETKKTAIQQLITQAQEVLNKTGSTKEELEKAIKDLKGLKAAPENSIEKTVWKENSEIQKLLTDLEAKLSTFPSSPPQTPPPGDKPESTSPLLEENLIKALDEILTATKTEDIDKLVEEKLDETNNEKQKERIQQNAKYVKVTVKLRNDSATGEAGKELGKILTTNLEKLEKDLLKFVEAKDKNSLEHKIFSNPEYKVAIQEKLREVKNLLAKSKGSSSVGGQETSGWTLGQKIGLGLVIIVGVIIAGAFVYSLAVRKVKSRKSS